MVAAQEAVLGTLALIAALVYFTVARLQARRLVSREARGPLRGFIVWWTGLGILGLVNVWTYLGSGVEGWGPVGARLYVYVLFAGIFVMLTGLLYYLLYLYTGDRASVYAAAAFYSLLFLFLVWLVEAHAPHVGPGHEGTAQEGSHAFHLHEEPPTWATVTLGLALVLPPFAAALAYFLLFFRTRDRTARYRIVLVSSGLLLWFGFSLLGTLMRGATGEEQAFAGRVTSQALGLLAALLVLMAYNPPRFLQDRLKLRPLESPPPADAVLPPRMAPWAAAGGGRAAARPRRAFGPTVGRA